MRYPVSLVITIRDGFVTGVNIHNRVGQKRDSQNIIDIAVPHISMVRTLSDCKSYSALQVHFHQLILSILTPQSVCESALSTYHQTESLTTAEATGSIHKQHATSTLN